MHVQLFGALPVPLHYIKLNYVNHFSQHVIYFVLLPGFLCFWFWAVHFKKGKNVSEHFPLCQPCLKRSLNVKLDV